MPEPHLFHAQSEDAILVRAVLKGDTGAFRELIAVYERLVVTIVCKMIDGKEDREDICQEVFLRVYDKLSSFRFGSKLSTWIGTIAFNQSVNFLKRKRSVLHEDMYRANKETNEGEAETEVDIADNSTLPDEAVMDKEQAQLLARNIEALPLLQRTIILLFHQEELSLEEIAVITSLPVNTVKSHLFRARKTLKTKIGEQLNQ
jgi:RNA polymerase sigma-70 factor (ECF subfamily)